MCLFALVDFSYHSSLGFNKCPKNKILQPVLVLALLTLLFCPFTSTQANEATDLPAWPFILNRFLQYLRRWIIRHGAFVEKYMTPSLCWFEELCCSASGESSLVNFAIEIWGRFATGIIGTQKDWVPVLRSPLESSRDSSILRIGQPKCSKKKDVQS